MYGSVDTFCVFTPPMFGEVSLNVRPPSAERMTIVRGSFFGGLPGIASNADATVQTSPVLSTPSVGPAALRPTYACASSSLRPWYDAALFSAGVMGSVRSAVPWKAAKLPYGAPKVFDVADPACATVEPTTADAA